MPSTHPPLHTSSSHRSWLEAEERRLLRFGRHVVRGDNLAHWLSADGTPDLDKPALTYMTARMAHVYFLGSLRGIPGTGPLAAQLLHGIDTTARDPHHGGWVDAAGAPGEPDKQAYTHAFVILAAATGTIAGHPDALSLLHEALKTTVDRFQDDGTALFADSVSADFSHTRDYRGINANMHMVEALLAASEATGEPQWADQAAAICTFVIEQAAANTWRIPEHYDLSWQPMLDYNRDHPADQFKPYGATIGHAFEWARLLVQAAPISGAAGRFTEAAANLVQQAVTDGWQRADHPGFAYTTDWAGNPVVDDRLFWVTAEAVGAAAALWQTTEDDRYRNWYTTWWDHIAVNFIDYQHGSWHHQRDPNNQLTNTIWDGKPDLYHAYQAVLLSLTPISLSLAGAVTTTSDRYPAQPPTLASDGSSSTPK